MKICNYFYNMVAAQFFIHVGNQHLLMATVVILLYPETDSKLFVLTDLIKIYYLYRASE